MFAFTGFYSYEEKWKEWHNEMMEFCLGISFVRLTEKPFLCIVVDTGMNHQQERKLWNYAH